MKLILVHGNFQDALLKKVSQIKGGFDPLSVTQISGETGSNLSSPSMFSEERLVILENPDLNSVEKILKEKSEYLTVLVKFSKSLDKSSAILKNVAAARGEIFSFEEGNQASIFPFLDMLGTRNSNAFKEFEKNYQEFGGQYLLTMIAYFLRRMTAKPKSGSDFMRQKIETQKRNFSLGKIRELYKEIIETDFKIKRGLIEERLGVTLLVRKILASG